MFLKLTTTQSKEEGNIFDDFANKMSSELLSEFFLQNNLVVFDQSKLQDMANNSKDGTNNLGVNFINVIRAFFVQKRIFGAKILCYSQNVTRKSCAIIFRTKKARI